MKAKTVVTLAFAAFAAVAGIAAFAEPSVEITKVKHATSRDGTVDLTYAVSGDFEGKDYDLLITVSSGDGTKSAVLTKAKVTAGTKTETVNVKTLLGAACPGVSFFAKLFGGLPGVQLWEDGPIFAECNVGATKPEEYGYYFWWGDTVGYKRNGSSWDAVDGSTTGFLFKDGNCPTYGKTIEELRSTGWIDSKDNLVVSDDATNRDAARAHLGAPWRMMTDAEVKKLVSSDYCTTEWTTQNGVYGLKVTGKGAYASNSIFLPANGYGSGSNLYNDGEGGNYWSSTPSTSTSGPWSLYFKSSSLGRAYGGTSSGRSVRPVR